MLMSHMNDQQNRGDSYSADDNYESNQFNQLCVNLNSNTNSYIMHDSSFYRRLTQMF